MDPVQSKHIYADRGVLIGWQPKHRLLFNWHLTVQCKEVDWKRLVEEEEAQSKNRRPVTQGQTGNRVVTCCGGKAVHYILAAR